MVVESEIQALGQVDQKNVASRCASYMTDVLCPRVWQVPFTEMNFARDRFWAKGSRSRSGIRRQAKARSCDAVCHAGVFLNRVPRRGCHPGKVMQKLKIWLCVSIQSFISAVAVCGQPVKWCRRSRRGPSQGQSVVGHGAVSCQMGLS